MLVAIGETAGCSSQNLVAAVEARFVDPGHSKVARVFRPHLRIEQGMIGQALFSKKSPLTLAGTAIAP